MAFGWRWRTRRDALTSTRRAFLIGGHGVDASEAGMGSSGRGRGTDHRRRCSGPTQRRLSWTRLVQARSSGCDPAVRGQDRRLRNPGTTRNDRRRQLDGCRSHYRRRPTSPRCRGRRRSSPRCPASSPTSSPKVTAPPSAAGSPSTANWLINNRSTPGTRRCPAWISPRDRRNERRRRNERHGQNPRRAAHRSRAQTA